MFSILEKDVSRKLFLNYLKTLVYKEEKLFKKHSIKCLPCSFDIETTSTRDSNGEKVAFMYAWVFGINGVTTLGRTWLEFITLLQEVKEILKVDINHRLLIFIHNESFEFQFIRKRFKWFQIFALDKHEPLYAVNTDGFEFRCSYKLSNYNLEMLGKNLVKYKVEKLVGSLDYDLIRHSTTILTEKEKQYIINDSLVVMAYIQECIENDGGISKIPYTSTGYVRNYCRNNCLRGINEKSKTKQNFIRKNYLSLMKRMTLTVDEYYQLKRAFAGGFTHANPYYVGKIMQNAESMDFTSSYPFVMVSEKFPMSEGVYIDTITEEELNLLKFSRCVLFDVEFTNIECSFPFDNIISLSKCKVTERDGIVVNNGRVVRAKKIVTTMTEVDYESIKKFYTWEDIKIYNVRHYAKGYLPINLIKSILKLYEDKTVLKDVAGMEVEYLKSKGMINATYGMCVTDIVRDTILYDDDEDEWLKENADIEKLIERYNKSNKRFLSYQWGVWTTAYARRNLYTGIYEFKEDYIYSDTDSLKGLNFSNHKDYIDNYNRVCEEKLLAVSKAYDIDFSKFAPKTKKGKIKMLGVWDYEGKFTEFKTLGAKRYMWARPISDEALKHRKDFCLNDKEYNLTVSGVNKKTAIPYLLEKDGDNIIKNFNKEFSVPEDYCGKLTHTYIEYEQQGEITDYTGKKGYYHEYSSVHLEKTSYTISENAEFTRFLYSIGNI